MVLSAHTPVHRPATLEDFLAIPESERFHEMIDGELSPKPMPSFKHARVQRKLGELLGPYDSMGANLQPGGWWLGSEVEILLPGRIPLRPDLAGWLRIRMLKWPEDFPVALLPDWTCEIVSPSDPKRDTVTKRGDYERAGIPYYWMVDLDKQLLTALQLKSGQYVISATARRGERVRAQPFNLIEIPVAVLFGDEE